MSNDERVISDEVVELERNAAPTLYVESGRV